MQRFCAFFFAYDTMKEVFSTIYKKTLFFRLEKYSIRNLISVSLAGSLLYK